MKGPIWRRDRLSRLEYLVIAVASLAGVAALAIFEGLLPAFIVVAVLVVVILPTMYILRGRGPR